MLETGVSPGPGDRGQGESPLNPGPGISDLPPCYGMVAFLLWVQVLPMPVCVRNSRRRNHWNSWGEGGLCMSPDRLNLYGLLTDIASDIMNSFCSGTKISNATDDFGRNRNDTGRTPRRSPIAKVGLGMLPSTEIQRSEPCGDRFRSAPSFA